MPNGGESKKNTKVELLEEALKLFSKYGYEAVSVAQIASAVNITPPALYKHYRSKQELFDAVVEQSRQGCQRSIKELGIDFTTNEETRNSQVYLSEEKQIEHAKRIFLHMIKGEYPKYFRRMMTIEQYHMPEIAKLYNEIYLDDQMKAHTVLFDTMIKAGKYRKADTKVMALEYLAPFMTLTEMCDREPDREEWAVEILVNHIREFNRNYRINS